VKRWHLGLATMVLALGLLTAPAAQAKKHKGPPPPPTVNLSSAVFLGSIFLSGDTSDNSGSLVASDSSCTLTVPTTSSGVSEGVGPNGSLLLVGSNGCSGMFELFLSGGPADLGALPTSGGIDSDTGVYGGTFSIVSTTDFTKQGQTVVWAGNYTQVFNIDPVGFFCGNLTFCANLGPAFGNETNNGGGLSYLLELNGFTWSVSGT
jgi:hypothetical protein